MKCPKCQAENLADSVFCEECSAPLEAACPACGTRNRSIAKFCRKCRASLTAIAAVAPDPRAYTPKHLADKILQSKSALEGERKQVTVLFADVKGSMELAEQLDPEEWHTILDRFFAILTDGVHRFEGTVNQYTGDGIMALFGAPIAHEDHAQRACYAALAAARRGARIRQRGAARSTASPFAVRIGLNSGEVVVGRIGDDLRMDYTAQGHTVGLAQRMEALAESGHICCLRAHGAAGRGLLPPAGPGTHQGQGRGRAGRALRPHWGGVVSHAPRPPARARPLPTAITVGAIASTSAK